METRKQMILHALDAFVCQRSGIESGNYFSPYDRGESWVEGVKAFRAEQRSITRDLRDYRALRLVVGLRTDITAEDLERDAFGGRLTLSFRETATKSGPAGGAILDYCTGQYFPTEYRKAACAVMASALWARKRLDMPPADGTFKKIIGKGPFAREADFDNVQGKSPGDWLRASFRAEFGRGIAGRWFS